MSAEPARVRDADRTGCLVVQVDPSRFTTPYDAGLAGGLAEVGVRVVWATRRLRPGAESEDLDPASVRTVFGDPGEGAGPLRPLLKGLAHAAGLVRLVRLARRSGAGAVHVQWAPVPLLDSLAMRWLRRRMAVVLTVHDTVPYNGQRFGLLRRAGFDGLLASADRLVVHTRGAADNLVARGVPRQRIAVVPHGPLALPGADERPPPPADGRYTVVLFGSIKLYKGLDVLVEALAALDADTRRRLRVVVAGNPSIDLGPIRARIAETTLNDVVEFRLGRLPDREAAAVLAEADAFVFPYRQIDASGVYHLVRPLGRWIVATRVGVFAEDLDGSGRGVAVPPGDVPALAAALAAAVQDRPTPVPLAETEGWAAIGSATRALYEEIAREKARPATIAPAGTVAGRSLL